MTTNYAIVKIAGKQYRVAKDEVIDVDLLEEKEGAEVEFSDVLFFHDGKTAKLGAPSISGVTVKGKVLGVVAGPKIETLKYKPSHNQSRKFGHRQRYSRVQITAIGK